MFEQKRKKGSCLSFVAGVILLLVILLVISYVKLITAPAATAPSQPGTMATATPLVCDKTSVLNWMEVMQSLNREAATVYDEMRVGALSVTEGIQRLVLVEARLDKIVPPECLRVSQAHYLASQLLGRKALECAMSAPVDAMDTCLDYENQSTEEMSAGIVELEAVKVLLNIP